MNFKPNIYKKKNPRKLFIKQIILYSISLIISLLIRQWLLVLVFLALIAFSGFMLYRKSDAGSYSLADYILQARSRRENPPTARKYEPQQTAQKTDPVLREEMVERIASSIRQTAATGSHFSKMLSPEEEEIMREIIREFME